jgi:hypothetical protein
MGTFPMSDSNPEANFFFVNRSELPPRSGLRFSFGVRGGLEVATTNGLVFGGWAVVVVGRHMERQAAIKQERRLAASPPQSST